VCVIARRGSAYRSCSGETDAPRRATALYNRREQETAMTNPHDPYGGQGYPPHPQQQQPQGWYPQQQPQQQQPQWGQQPQWQQQQQPQWQQQQQPQWQQQQQQPQWQQQQQPYQMPGQAQPAYGQQYDADPNAIASEASPQARAKFIERTYLHLGGAIAAFIVLETILQFLPLTDVLSHAMMAGNTAWFVVLALFMGVSWVANSWAQGSRSVGMQYAGLLLYTVAEAIIFMPLIYLGRTYGLLTGPDIMMAAVVTMAMFSAMTAYVFITKTDFSFMKGILSVLTMAALGLIAGSLIFGFTLGLAFVIGMIVLASGYILFYTSNVLRHYRVNQHVAAALALFAAVALLFWYIVQLFMRR
jgi:FtsH-binding integral membrane protein